MSQKIISFSDGKKQLQKKDMGKKHPNRKTLKGNFKMLFFVIAAGLLTGLVCWNYFVESSESNEVKIPESHNITYNAKTPDAMTSAQVANEFDKFEGRPIFLYIYTTWCSACKKSTPKINEILRELQNTDLRVMALAIDRDLDAQSLQNYLNNMGDLYFEPRYLAFKGGFKDFLAKRGIKYDNRIPFAVLISADGETLKTISATRSKRHIRNKIIKELYL